MKHYPVYIDPCYCYIYDCLKNITIIAKPQIFCCLRLKLISVHYSWTENITNIWFSHISFSLSLPCFKLPEVYWYTTKVANYFIVALKKKILYSSKITNTSCWHTLWFLSMTCFLMPRNFFLWYQKPFFNVTIKYLLKKILLYSQSYKLCLQNTI